MRLRQPIRQYIYEQGWARLRPIQEAAIRLATETADNFVLAAPTAAGKTEAAFLPAISDVRPADWHDGVRILMVSPLVALINDQFQRITRLCEAMDIPVTAWHGEANTAAKRRLVKSPAGIVLITPESLEAMLDGHPERVEKLFSQLDWIFVDELHQFLSGARGTQLRALLLRLQFRTGASPRYVGMSATIAEGDYAPVKAFFPPERTTRILLDRTPMPREISMEWTSEEALHDAIYEHLKKENLLVFPNSRRKVEEIAHALQERVRRDDLPARVMAHHSSVEKALRLEAEEWAKMGLSRFALCATSTLELGIDIGAVDAVCQVEAPYSAASLLQRMGRSGRSEVWGTDGVLRREPSRLHFFATDDESFLQGAAAISMIGRGQVEAAEPTPRPYDVFAHQILATVLENSGVPLGAIYAMRTWPVFSFLSKDDVAAILDDMIARDILELLEGEPAELFLGLEGEKIATRYDFYAMFLPQTEYEVVSGKERIGHMPLGPEIVPGARFLLSARVWEVDTIEDAARRIFVHPAKKGRAPAFAGTGADISQPLRREMLRLLFEPDALTALSRSLSGDGSASAPPNPLAGPSRSASSPAASSALSEAIRRVRGVVRENRLVQFLESDGDDAVLGLFCGTAGERTLYLLLRAMSERENPHIYWDARRGRIFGEDVKPALALLRHRYGEEGDGLLKSVTWYLMNEPALLRRMLSSVKYVTLLPLLYQARYVQENLCVSSLKELLE